jgi:hypothetical protein
LIIPRAESSSSPTLLDEGFTGCTQDPLEGVGVPFEEAASMTAGKGGKVPLSLGSFEGGLGEADIITLALGRELEFRALAIELEA